MGNQKIKSIKKKKEFSKKDDDEREEEWREKNDRGKAEGEGWREDAEKEEEGWYNYVASKKAIHSLYNNTILGTQHLKTRKEYSNILYVIL